MEHRPDLVRTWRRLWDTVPWKDSRSKLDQHEILVLIDDRASCCESWGYVHSEEEDLESWIGAEIRELCLTDTVLNTVIVKKTGCGEYGFDGGGIQFVDFVTDRGTLQLAVYNAHNGYYGHGIIVAIDLEIKASDTPLG